MLAFSNDYYGMIFRATQSVELFCAYNQGESFWIYSIEKESPINHETKAVKIYVEFYSLLCIIEVSETI